MPEPTTLSARLRAERHADDGLLRDYDILLEAADALDACGAQSPRGTWQPIATAPRGEFLLGVVEGQVRFIIWCKTSHVPLYGWNLADQGVEDYDLCEPTHWMPLPASPVVIADGQAAR